MVNRFRIGNSLQPDSLDRVLKSVINIHFSLRRIQVTMEKSPIINHTFFFPNIRTLL